MCQNDTLIRGQFANRPELKVMLVGDDSVSLRLMKIFIERGAYDAAVKICFKDSLLCEFHRLSEGFPDLLIIDCCMRGTTGLELLMAIKDFFLKRIERRPPFRIVLCVDYPIYTPGFIDLAQKKGYIDELIRRGVLEGLPEDDRSVIDAVISKPLNGKKLELLFREV